MIAVSLGRGDNNNYHNIDDLDPQTNTSEMMIEESRNRLIDFKFPRDSYNKQQMDCVVHAAIDRHFMEDISDLDPKIYSAEHMNAIAFTNRKQKNIDISEFDPLRYTPQQIGVIIQAKCNGVPEEVINLLDPTKYDHDQMTIVIVGTIGKVKVDMTGLDPSEYNAGAMLNYLNERVKG